MNIDLYTQDGKKGGSVEVSNDIFEVAFSKELVHQAVVRQLANARQATASSKTKGMIRGGGKKPFKQKGTGRARAGSSRSPIWRGGGVVFGPTGEENYSKDMNKKQRRKAIFMALSDRASDNQILAVDNFVSDGSKTKDVSSMIEALPCGRDVLIVVDRESESLKRASANISNAKTILVDYLNVCDLLKYETVLFVKEALESVETIFTSKVTK